MSFEESVSEIFNSDSSLVMAKSKIKNTLKLKWKNELAIERVYQIYQISGPPNAIDTSEGGVAIWLSVPAWYSEQGQWVKFEVRDESDFIHLRPAPHADFWFQTVKLHIPADKISDVLSISESFSYYALGKEFTAGCHFYGASVVSAFCAKSVAEGKVSVDSAKVMYTELIKKSVSELEAVLKSGKKMSNVSADAAMEKYIFTDF